MNDSVEKLNLIAQQRITFEDGLSWFEGFDRGEKLGILGSLNMCVLQAHPAINDLAPAIKLVGIKETYTPCAMIKNDAKGLSSIKGLDGLDKLKDLDLGRAFLLLVGLLSIADHRKRTESCKGECSHWWRRI